MLIIVETDTRQLPGLEAFVMDFLWVKKSVETDSNKERM